MLIYQEAIALFVMLPGINIRNININYYLSFNFICGDFRFLVDDIPIRVYKNNTSKGVDYPLKPMKIEASLWDGDSWATDGGQTKTNWAYAPFKAHFQGFHVNGCSVQMNSNNANGECYSENKYFWNRRSYQRLDSDQQRAYEKVRKTYMNYDYCSDRSRYPTPPPECLDQP